MIKMINFNQIKINQHSFKRIITVKEQIIFNPNIIRLNKSLFNQKSNQNMINYK